MTKTFWKPAVWRPIVGYEGIYEVSQDGDVRSCKRSVERTRIHGHSHTKDTHIAHYEPRMLKPYKIYQNGKIKYHLHRRIQPGARGQTDEYVYAEDIVKQVFPELYSEKHTT